MVAIHLFECLKSKKRTQLLILAWTPAFQYFPIQAHTPTSNRHQPKTQMLTQTGQPITGHLNSERYLNHSGITSPIIWVGPWWCVRIFMYWLGNTGVIVFWGTVGRFKTTWSVLLLCNFLLRNYWLLFFISYYSYFQE